MADLNYKSIAKDMIAAMETVVKDHISDIRELAEDELEDFAKRSVILTKKVRDGKLNKRQAEAILRIRRNAVETVLISIAGISVVAAQDAINAALGVLKGAIGSLIPGISIIE